MKVVSEEMKGNKVVLGMPILSWAGPDEISWKRSGQEMAVEASSNRLLLLESLRVDRVKEAISLSYGQGVVHFVFVLDLILFLKREHIYTYMVFCHSRFAAKCNMNYHRHANTV